MAITKKNAAPKLFKPVFAALLAALILLLTFTVGSLRFGPITITLNCLPLAVGAVFLGPMYGAILGLVFGLAQKDMRDIRMILQHLKKHPIGCAASCGITVVSPVILIH